MRTDLFDYAYPRTRIADHPCTPRHAARLLVIRRRGGSVRHMRFENIADLLAPGDCLVVNDSRVMPVRLEGRKERTGGRVGLLLSKQHSPTSWEALVRPGRVRPGTQVSFGSKACYATILGRANGDGSCRVRLSDALRRQLFQKGRIPLPPYMKRAPRAQDTRWYQTVYARRPGSIAAPTAGLHFSEGLLRRVRSRGIRIARLTCHIGYASFRTVRAQRIEQHEMHAESFTVPAAVIRSIRRAKETGNRVIAVGTSTTRVLETLGAALLKGPISRRSGSTRLFIRPGHRFKILDALITNFHMPRTTLLMLVSAFAGRKRLLAAYTKGIRSGYRLFSYGDAMLII